MSWNSKLSFGACPWFVTLADEVLVVFVAEFWILCSAVFPAGERKETRMNIVRLGQWCSSLKNGCLVWIFQPAFLMLYKPNMMQIIMVLQQCDCSGAKNRMITVCCLANLQTVKRHTGSELYWYSTNLKQREVRVQGSVHSTNQSVRQTDSVLILVLSSSSVSSQV